MGVQINGDTGNVIATKGTFSGDVGIGGTLTYEDVTNVDSVGLITARQGIKIGSGVGVAASISVDGNAEFAGIVTATTFKGDGSNLSGISVGVTTASASMSGITTVLDLSKDDIKITVSGITTVDVRGGTEGNSHTLRIHNSGIATVGFSTYFLFPSGASPIIPIADGTISLISFTVDRQGAVGLATQLLAGSSVNFS
tara:strand:- start:13 stop:606 length:594 start_codon:yes stop_codon:yes gene_type:complete